MCVCVVSDGAPLAEQKLHVWIIDQGYEYHKQPNLANAVGVNMFKLNSWLSVNVCDEEG